MSPLAAWCAAVLAITAVAEPPANPGRAAERNPYGTPPGLNGGTPGRSGEAPSRGKPPVLPLPAPASAPPATTPEPAPSPSGSPAVPPPVSPARLAPPDLASPAPPKRGRGEPGTSGLPPALAQYLERLTGWEPSWRHMADAFTEVRLRTRRESVVRGARTERESVFLRKGDRVRQDIVAVSGSSTALLPGPQAWIAHPGVIWSRPGRGPWHRAVQPSTTPAPPLDQPARLINLWQATPVEVDHGPFGQDHLHFRRRDGGLMRWDVEPGTRRVVRMESFTPEGGIEWTEDRAYDDTRGRDVLVRRVRRTLLPEPGDEREAFDWAWQAGAVSEAELVPSE